VEGQLLAVLGLAFVLGLKHATDADHVAAVTTFLSDRPGVFRSCWIGVFWGAGHTLALAAAGLCVLFLKVTVSARLESRLEMAVALMLIVLGGRVLYKAWTGKFELHRHPHSHASDAAPHVHWHLHSRRRLQTHSDWLHLGLRPLLVGMVHGAAGSGALTLLALSTIRSAGEGLLYILIFGVGSIAGMLAVSVLLALPLRWIGQHTRRGYRQAQAAAGLLSCAFGTWLAIDIWRNLPL
jgi:ABC-type nickel/cobalt efflux system permease component RcnA